MENYIVYFELKNVVVSWILFLLLPHEIGSSFEPLNRRLQRHGEPSISKRSTSFACCWY